MCPGIFVDDLGWEKSHSNGGGVEFGGTGFSISQAWDYDLALEKVRLRE